MSENKSTREDLALQIAKLSMDLSISRRDDCAMLLKELKSMVWYAEHPCEMPSDGHVCGPENNCDSICQNWAHFQQHVKDAHEVIAKVQSE